jgi:hypothetical protein
MAFLKDLEPTPAPVDAVVADQPVLDLHHLDEIHLFAVGLSPRIFPNQRTPVREESSAIPLACRRLMCEHNLQKCSQLLPSRDYAFLRLQ